MLSIDALQAVECSAMVWYIAAFDTSQDHSGCRPSDAEFMATALY